jgi:hypothetical protein
MTSWNQHIYVNKLANYWKGRELSSEEQKTLYIRSVINYQGYWINGILHLIPIYIYYKRGFFSISDNFLFWKNSSCLLLVLIISKSQIDHMFNLSLGFEIQRLSDKYESPKDEMRRKYHQEKAKLEMQRLMKYEELRDKGKQVSDIIQFTLRKGES